MLRGLEGLVPRMPECRCRETLDLVASSYVCRTLAVTNTCQVIVQRDHRRVGGSSAAPCMYLI